MKRREFCALAGAAAVSRAASVEKVAIVVGGKPFTSFYCGKEWDKPFLYPLLTASGRVISRGWPVEPREGETNDHAWHRGIWFGHGDVNKHDFWREQGRQKTSCLFVKGAPSLTRPAGRPSLSAELTMSIPAGRSIGSVREDFTFWEDCSNRFIDARISVHADAGEALRFGDTDDGGFGFRLADDFREDRGAILRNSDGLQGTDKIWGKPARWVDYSARLDGNLVGVAVFDHPANLRHPTTWHARGYSLCAANPFGLGSFTRDKSKDGSHMVPAGGKLEFRYRVAIYEGPADIEALFGDFASGR